MVSAPSSRVCEWGCHGSIIKQRNRRAFIVRAGLGGGYKYGISTIRALWDSITMYSGFYISLTSGFGAFNVFLTARLATSSHLLPGSI